MSGNKRKYKLGVQKVEQNVVAPVTIKKKTFFEELLARPLWQYGAVVLFVIILYGNTLSLDYALDDRLMITENTFTKKGFAGIKDILTNDSFVGFFGEKKNLLTGGRYRPLSHIMFAVEYQIFADKPFYGHLFNILYYALCCIILLMVLKHLFQSYKGTLAYLPYLVTLFFIAHPLHTEIVANIKGRDDILSFLLSMLTLLFVLKYIKTGRVIYALINLPVFFLTLMSKENAITFLGVIPLCMYFFYKPRLKHYIIGLLPIVLASAVFIMLRFKILGELKFNAETELLNNPFINATTGERFATIFYTMGIYLKLLLIPHTLTHDYYPFHIEIVNWSSYKAFVPLLIYILLGIYAVWGTLKKQLPAFSAFFYLMTFSISSNIVFNIGTFMNERFMFTPLLGFCIVLSLALIKIAEKFYKEKPKIISFVWTASLVILALYTLRTITRNPVWKDDFTLFTSDVNVSVNSAKCNVSAGGVLIEASQKLADPVQKEEYLNRAVKYLSHGLEVHPKYVAGWVLYGNAFLYLEKYNEALTCYENALNIAPQNKDALNNMAHLAQLLSNKKYYDFSITVFNRLNNRKPLSFDNRYELARAYEGKGSIDTAMSTLFGILAEDSTYHLAHSKLGELYGKVLNNLDKSLYHLNEAYKFKPDDASNLENLGIAYGLKKDFKNSLFFFEEAMKQKPDKPELYMNISQTYAMMGQKDKAAEYQKKAQEVAAGKK